jgi:hypothetical protein
MARAARVPDLWDELVEKICAEWQAGTLAYDDAIDDLVFLGFEVPEACARLGNAERFTGEYFDAILSRGRASPSVPRR